jgi:hypothetical protein
MSGYRIRFALPVRAWVGACSAPQPPIDRIKYGRAVKRRWGAAVAIFGLGFAVASALLAPLRATATDSDLKHAYAFRLGASNGYSILAFAASQRADGRGEIVVIVDRKNADAVYAAAATVTAAKVEANLGDLGDVSLDVVPSGRKKKLQSRCGAEPEAVSFEPPSYRGIFEFHGEEGYTDATTAAPRDYTRFFFDLVCPGTLSGETGGADLPGARLRLHSREGLFHLDLQANKNSPRASSRFAVEIHEKRQGIAISRSTTVHAGAAAFDYDPMLGTATLEPPAPFAGRASFHRGAAITNRWSGKLTVDLPGRSNVPLTGPGVGATLVPACWHEGAGRFRC